MFNSLFGKTGLMVALAALFLTVAGAQAQAGTSNESSAFSIPEAQLIQPAELNKLLSAEAADKPLVLQVGSRVLFDQAHIAGSEYMGPGSQSAGLNTLKKRVASLPKTKAIVLYCGCCPWNRCPNVGPAYKLLNSLGYSNVKVLYVGNNFGSDWVEKGYPVERSR